ncbi:MAG: hypothetical protein JW863_00330 [Chitinispirillaceae bacterium]|nr:hypothetical protein [Chitinispirillaceae bacterium]
MMVWQNSFNCHDSGENTNDYGTCVALIPEMKGFYVGGTSSSFGPNNHFGYDACLIKVDNNGEMQWFRTIGDRMEFGSIGSESAGAICATTDGGAVMAVVVVDSTYYILSRYDKDGAQIWQKTDSIGKRYSIGGLRQLQDGGFMMVGGIEISSWRYNAVWIVRFDSSGVKLWEKKYENGSSTAVGIVPCDASDSLIIVADADTAYSSTETGTVYLNHAWLLKIGPGGDTAWTKKYFGLNPLAAAAAGDAGFIVSGNSNQDTLRRMVAQITRFSNLGDSLWTRTVNLMDQNNGVGAAALGNGTVLLVGTSTSQLGDTRGTWLKCYSSGGDSLWYKEYINRYRTAYGAYGLQNDSYVVVGGGIPDGYISGYNDIWLMEAAGSADVVFEAFLGGRSDDAVHSVVEVSGGYLLIGRSDMYGRTSGMCIYTNRDGSLRWMRAFPEEYVFLKDNGDAWLFSGADSGGYFIACTDTSANLLWKKTVHADTAAERIKACWEAGSGGYYLLGQKRSSTDLLIRLDQEGTEKWSTTDSGWHSRAIVERKNGSLAMITAMNLYGIDSTGETAWLREFTAPDTFIDVINGNQIVETDDGRLTAFFGIGDGTYHLYIIRTDSSGNELWHKVYKDHFSRNFKTRVVNGCQYLICGSTVGGRDAYFAYLDSSANVIWEQYYNQNDSLTEFFYDVHVLPSGNILLAGGQVDAEWRDWDMMISEWGKDTPVAVSRLEPALHTQPFIARRNGALAIRLPETAGGHTPVTVDVLTLDGRVLLRGFSVCGSMVIPLKGRRGAMHPSGVMIARIRSGGHNWTYTVPEIQ